MKKLSTKDILSIAVATVATAAFVAGVVIVAKKCKKAIAEYEQEMLNAENVEAEPEEDNDCDISSQAYENNCDTDVEQQPEEVPLQEVTEREEEITE